ncbi:kinase-like protein [Aspergillus ibericus CBS 121593]|uniref:Kinase-like protein n=1 Tax=Aspergillus ibericus CBS 121593 TaxID=1448316 RepID=A0A395HEI5_9EURO|nr:kinase-like protein [Aspergillus ibericus CBS 121593]RAL05525.1 kinase-like protein [Aspergillus ibericus CBS 121593]
MSALTQSRQVPLTQGTSIKSDSGQTYRIEELLTHGGKTALHVYRASAEGKQYVVKNLIPGEFDYQFDLQKSLSPYPNIRTVTDTVRETEVFIYPFLRGDLLRFNIKPNNILVDYTEPATEGQEIIVNQVQISDLDATVIVPPGRWLRGPLCGNAMWRSAESWARSRQNQSSDVFSFALVMVYVMANRMVLRVPDDQLNAEDAWRHILPLHLSYFANIDGLEQFLDHIGEENPYFQRMLELVSTFGPENPLLPVKGWTFLEPELRDLVEKMTPLDPRRRITSKEALEHPWFKRTE